MESRISMAIFDLIHLSNYILWRKANLFIDLSHIDFIKLKITYNNICCGEMKRKRNN